MDHLVEIPEPMDEGEYVGWPNGAGNLLGHGCVMCLLFWWVIKRMAADVRYMSMLIACNDC